MSEQITVCIADNDEDYRRWLERELGSAGDIRITAGDDAIQATQDVTITGGALTVTATGKAVNSKGSQDVASGVINGK